MFPRRDVNQLHKSKGKRATSSFYLFAAIKQQLRDGSHWLQRLQPQIRENILSCLGRGLKPGSFSTDSSGLPPEPSLLKAKHFLSC